MATNNNKFFDNLGNFATAIGQAVKESKGNNEAFKQALSNIKPASSGSAQTTPTRAPLQASPYTPNQVVERYGNAMMVQPRSQGGQADSDDENSEGLSGLGTNKNNQITDDAANLGQNNDEKNDSNDNRDFWDYGLYGGMNGGNLMFQPDKMDLGNLGSPSGGNQNNPANDTAGGMSDELAYSMLFPQAAQFAPSILKSLSDDQKSGIRKTAQDIQATRVGNMTRSHAIDTANNQLKSAGYSNGYVVGDDGKLYIDDGSGNRQLSNYSIGDDGNIQFILGDRVVPVDDEAGRAAAMYIDLNRVADYGNNWGKYQALAGKDWWKDAMRSELLNRYYQDLITDYGWDINSDQGFDDYWNYMTQLNIDPQNMSERDRRLIYGDSASAMHSTNAYLASNPEFQYGISGSDAGDLSDEAIGDMLNRYGILTMDTDNGPLLYIPGSAENADSQNLINEFLDRAVIEDASLRGLGSTYGLGELNMIEDLYNGPYTYGYYHEGDPTYSKDYGDISDIDQGDYNPFALDIMDVANTYRGNGSVNPRYNDIVGNKKSNLGYYARKGN